MGIVQTRFFAGHGKLPAGAAAKAAYDTLAVTVEVDPVYGVILDAECTLATTLGRRFVADLLRGYSLKDGISPIIASLSQYYQGAVKAALIAALRDLEAEYQRATGA